MRGGVLEARSARRRAVAKDRTVSESGPADARRAGVLGKAEQLGGTLAQVVGAPGAGDEVSFDLLGARGIVIARDVPEPAPATHREVVRIQLAAGNARKSEPLEKLEGVVVGEVQIGRGIVVIRPLALDLEGD